MEYIFLAGRILYGVYFLYAGFGHFTRLGGMTGYAASRGVPFPKLAVIVSGLFIFLGGLGVLTGIYIEYALVLIALFLLIVTPAIHRFWGMADPNAKMSEQINFTKNLGLLGATLMLLALATAPGMF